MNPFPAMPGTEHFRAQTITLRSMASARKVAHVLAPDLRIEHVALTLEGDGLPKQLEFDHHFVLNRTVADFGEFNSPRPLPLLHDLITAAPADPDDIIIFTNVDISVVPTFYTFIMELFTRGTDCAVINRRTISDVYDPDSTLDLMYAETGKSHPGHDCFAFRASLLDKFEPFHTCVGIAGVARPLLYNLLAHAKAPTVLLDAHVTFHIGNDKTWRKNDFEDYTAYNRKEIGRVASALLEKPEAKMQLLTRLNSATGSGLMTPEMREMVGLPANARRSKASLFRRITHKLRRLAKGSSL